MSLRPATTRDIPSITNLLTQAFWDEDAISRFMHPHRAQYPNDVAKYWRRGLRGSWWEEGRTHLVVEGEEGVGVVGYAAWVFVDDGEFWNMSDLRRA